MAVCFARSPPVAVGLDSLHEEVIDPKPVEKVSGSLLLLSVVLLKVENVENIGMPRLDVNCKGSRAFATALVNVARGDVKDAEHRDESVADSLRPLDVRTCAERRRCQTN